MTCLSSHDLLQVCLVPQPQGKLAGSQDGELSSTCWNAEMAGVIQGTRETSSSWCMEWGIMCCEAAKGWVPLAVINTEPDCIAVTKRFAMRDQCCVCLHSGSCSNE